MLRSSLWTRDFSEMASESGMGGGGGVGLGVGVGGFEEEIGILRWMWMVSAVAIDWGKTPLPLRPPPPNSPWAAGQLTGKCIIPPKCSPCDDYTTHKLD